MSKKTVLFVLAALALTTLTSHAAVPEKMNYQGRLTDNIGNPLTGTFDLTFRIYSDSLGGGIVYDETHTSVTVTDGLFNVLIGGLSFVTPFDDYVFVSKDRYMSIQVDADPEMSPRVRLVTSPYAFRVSTVDGATAGTITGRLGVAGDAYVEGDMGVGTALPSAGAAGSVSRVLEIEAPPGGGSTNGAALSLTDGGVANTWDMIARSNDGVLGFYANGNGLLYVESNGDVGIGTQSPSTGVVNKASRVLEIDAPFDAVNNSGAALTLVDGTGSVAWDIIGTSEAGNNLAIYANNKGLVYIEPNGDFGLNTTTPSTGKVNVASRVLEIKAPLDAANNSGAALTLSDGSFGSSWDVVATSAAGGLAIYGNSTQVMYMEPNGQVGIGTSTPSVELHVVGDICYTGSIGACSDARYKTEVETLSHSLEKIQLLRGVTYEWKRDEFPDRKFDDKQHLGFIAQEIEQVFPEMVMTDDTGYKSVDYGRLTPVLVEAIKAQQKQIDELNGIKAELAQMKELVNQLAQQSKTNAGSQFGMK